MKRFFIILLLILTFNSFAQTNLKFGISASSIIDYDFSNVYVFKSSFTTVNSHFPFKSSLNLQFNLSPKFSIISGYNLIYRYMEVNLYTTTVGALFYGCKMYTSEIPLLFRYNVNFEKSQLDLFCELGATFDYMYSTENVFGRYREILDFIIITTWGYFYTLNFPTPFIPAVHAKIGLSNEIGDDKGSFEVGVSYHYQIPKKIANEIIYYYNDGVGNVTRDNYEFFTRSSYLGIDFSYYLPFKITFSNHKK